MANFRIRITSRTYIKRTLNRISNMLLNEMMRLKEKNGLVKRNALYSRMLKKKL